MSATREVSNGADSFGRPPSNPGGHGASAATFSPIVTGGSGAAGLHAPPASFPDTDDPRLAEDDPLSAATGLVVGGLLGALSWGIILAAVLALIP